MPYSNIDKPSKYFNTVTWTGTGSAMSITGVGFQPDWVWYKGRSFGYNHGLFDAVRGTTNFLKSNATDAEATVSGVTAFNSDGFSLGTDAGGVGSGNTFVAWNWLGANSTVSNTSGSITSTVSANTTAGFSIVSYTGNATNGATVGHGLSSPPQMVITKGRGSADAWQILTNIYHNYSEGDFIYLDTTDAKANSVNVSFLPTSTTWQMKSGQAGNTAITKIAYCFHSVKGFSKFGSYTGNGSADGTFVYTGFKPAFLIVKRYNDAGYDWLMYDNKRQVEFNVVDDFLKPNLSDAETTGNANQSLDFLSNGVKFRGSGASSNGSGASYIYMAFAENPFVSSKGLPTTAR